MEETRVEDLPSRRRMFPVQGWVGLALVTVFWTLNWSLPGARTHWGFFPLWVGYCLAVDGLVYLRSGTSLITRNWRKYIGLFGVSAPVWWLFETLNLRLLNWRYEGAELFSPLQFWFWATLSFTTVVPAVFGSAELMSTFPWFQRPKRGPVIGADRRTTGLFFLAGWVMLALMLAWPRIFFPFVWISIYFILEPINVWLGNHSLVDATQRGNWQPVITLWAGVLMTAFFWEMWNYFSFPKWIYQVPWGNAFHLFEMPLLGYGGYLPFSLELYAVYHLLAGWFAQKRSHYVKLGPRWE